jgi:hypothetical protein
MVRLRAVGANFQGVGEQTYSSIILFLMISITTPYDYRQPVTYKDDQQMVTVNYLMAVFSGLLYAGLKGYNQNNSFICPSRIAQ